MTTLPPTEFTVDFDLEPGALTVRVRGELDHGTSDDLLDAVVERLTATGGSSWSACS